jgi:RNA polymerase sigma-70 factor, ECF subfamily
LPSVFRKFRAIADFLGDFDHAISSSMVETPTSGSIEALMDDNSNDWERIVRENANGMLRLAMRIVGSSADAEELVQDAFLRAYRYRQREQVHNWGGLLHRFVVNIALDHLRKRRTTVALSEIGLASSVEDPARLAETRELANQLRHEIVRLPRQQSEVFCLSDLDGKSNRQIAESLGIKEGAVATALHKARKQLTAAMARLSRTE